MLLGIIKNIGVIEDMKELKNKKTALVLGGNGFIGHHLARRLKKEGYQVRVVDIKEYEYGDPLEFCHENIILDLRNPEDCIRALEMDGVWDEVFTLAADMGGANFVFTGENDADIMHNSALIHLNILHLHERYKKIFYSSSACIYPEFNQIDPNNPLCTEDSAKPALPDSCYGWEKLFSEELYLAYARNKGVDVRIARFHNIFGEEGTWDGGREKAPAALCRKIIKTYGGIEMWGDGKQTRSFLYIDECVEGVRRLMESDFKEPVNIGSEEMVSINNFALLIASIENKDIVITHIDGPIGVAGRNSDNTLIQEKLGWSPSQSLIEGITKTYFWIKEQVRLSDMAKVETDSVD